MGLVDMGSSVGSGRRRVWARMVGQYAWVLMISGVNAVVILGLWAGGKYQGDRVHDAWGIWFASTVVLTFVAMAAHVRSLDRRIREFEELERRALQRTTR